ncbi:hypothetical protein BDA99DRAFT_555426 [Phascolomyces articulosus]|uniref:Uncharacterized protein n=1 Tax=Phascolomyces articulosus TaxID=60185 RepID=A0AAD5PKI1_9FUNG|nr:hypothetical protein BDA99DRAFT_555426 [Phascolomyces articulosus]
MESSPVVRYSHYAPVLSDVSKAMSDDARLYDLGSEQSTQVAEHTQPIKAVNVISELGNQTLIIASSCLEVQPSNQIVVAATSEKDISVFDLRNLGVVDFKERSSRLKWQIQVVRCFLDSNCYTITSIEGHVNISYTDKKESIYEIQRKCFTFNYHRDKIKDVFAVNDISFHPWGTFFSACGSDGTISFWDKDSRHYPKATDLVWKT